MDLKYLGKHIVAARKDIGSTQQELSAQTEVSLKTIQAIEKGHKNPTYKTLLRLIVRLGISPNILFPITIAIECKELQHFIWKFQFCNSENQKILLNVRPHKNPCKRQKQTV